MNMTRSKIRFHSVMVLALAGNLSTCGVAHAESGRGERGRVAKAEASPEAAPVPAGSSSRYSLPWQLRPATIGSEARLDSVVAAFNDANGNLDVAITSGLSVRYQLTDEITPIMRLGFVRNNAPGAALDGSSFANPLVGASYGRSSGPFRWALFGATTIPIGTGGGNDPNVKAARTNLAATTARPADDAMFAVNYLTEMVGGDFAYVSAGFSAQAEATLQALVRVRGGESSSAFDAFRTNAAVGLHLGYFIGSHFSIGSDLRYGRWLSRPTTLNVVTGAKVPLSDRNMDVFTLALGLRLHFRFGKQTTIHPGVSVMRGFDGRAFAAPLVTQETTAVQLDVPVAF
ncbi:MAG: hypothetical protein ACOY0T_19800 [Myxococcota bacterium]